MFGDKKAETRVNELDRVPQESRGGIFKKNT